MRGMELTSVGAANVRGGGSGSSLGDDLVHRFDTLLCCCCCCFCQPTALTPVTRPLMTPPALATPAPWHSWTTCTSRTS